MITLNIAIGLNEAKKMTFDLKRYVIKSDRSVKDALKKVDKNNYGMILVISASDEVLGIATDGDIRRALIDGLTLEDSIADCMNKNYIFATVQTTSSKVVYDGNTQIDGVPRPSSPIPLEFLDIAGSMCGRLLPTGNQIDTVNGLNVTMIDNGMPCVIIKASDLKITGYEDTEVLEKNLELRKTLEELRKACGQLMNLGDVSKKTVPKMTIVSTSKAGGIINTRTFIPHRCHSSIGVFGAVSVATACPLDQTITAKISSIPNGDTKICSVEHPSGQTQIVVSFKDKEISSTAILRTARKLLDGLVFSDLN